MSEIQELLDTEMLNLLYAGGVDNWDGYQYAEFDPEKDTDSEILEALDAAGVDNWEWISASLKEFSDYEDDVLDSGVFITYLEWEEQQKSIPAPTPEPVAPVVQKNSSESSDVLISILLGKGFTQEDAEQQAKIIWKRSFAPDLFEKATKSSGNIEEIRTEYLKLILRYDRLCNVQPD